MKGKSARKSKLKQPAPVSPYPKKSNTEVIAELAAIEDALDREVAIIAAVQRLKISISVVRRAVEKKRRVIGLDDVKEGQRPRRKD